MAPRRCHAAQEGDAFCLLEMNVFWVRKVQINPRTTAKDHVKVQGETGTKVSISTVKRVLYQHNLKGRSARKKPLLQNRHKKARLRFATAHGDKDHTFCRNVLWSDEKKKSNCLEEKGGCLQTEEHHPNREAVSCCGGALLQEGLVHFTK